MFCYVGITGDSGMNIDDQKTFALKFCMDIAHDYSEEEVKKFTPPSVQKAWKVGREVIDFELAENRKKLKDFKL